MYENNKQNGKLVMKEIHHISQPRFSSHPSSNLLKFTPAETRFHSPSFIYAHAPAPALAAAPAAAPVERPLRRFTNRIARPVTTISSRTSSSACGSHTSSRATLDMDQRTLSSRATVACPPPCCWINRMELVNMPSLSQVSLPTPGRGDT